MTSPYLAHNPFESRDDVARAVHGLVEPLLPAYRTGGSRVSLGASGAHFDRAAEDLEGFARPLWGVVPMVVGGSSFAHWDLIRHGLAEGSDPGSVGYWGRPGDHDQRLVEMAALGVMLALVPEHTWDPLDGATRDRLIEWLGRVNTLRLHETNWQFFRVMVNLGFARVGVETDEDAVAASLELIESHYVGDGWYRDGIVPGTFDHYVPWAYHFYGLVYATLAADSDPDRSERYRDRARRFAADYVRWFDARGSVVPFGRSLTYRFATAALWGALVFADEEALPWPTIKGLYLRHLRGWAAQPITRADGLLSIGYGYENAFLAENYNSPGSPYWAMKGFFALAAPASHPFWLAPEAEHVPHVGASIQHPPAVIVSEDASHTVLLNGGRGLWVWRQAAAKYGKFAYSSRFAFSLDTDDGWTADVSDSMLMVRDASRGRAVRHRVDSSGIIDDCVWSCWRPFDEVSIVTVLHGGAPWHSRLHVVQTDRDLVTVEGGFAVGWDGGAPDEPVAERDEHPGRAAVTVRDGTSVILDHPGDTDRNVARVGTVRPMNPGMNLVAARVLVPTLAVALGPGTHRLGCHVAATAPGTQPIEPPGPATEQHLDAILEQVIAAAS